MKKIELHKCRKAIAMTATMYAALALSACAGGDDKGLASTANANAVADSSSAGPSIKVDGQSMAISADIPAVTIVTPPVTWSADGSLPQGTIRLSSRGHLASQLKSHAPGAYTTLPWGTESLSLSKGTVTDIAGNGQFAIGRWTDGSDSSGRSYNENQGRVWAIGAPVDVKVPSTGLSCAVIAATRPTSSDGNTVPGVLKSATAKVANESNSLGVLESKVSLTLRYSIGSDVDQTAMPVAPLGAMYTSRMSRSSLHTTFLGPDASKPYLVVSYGVHSPTAGLINGLAILNCA